MPAYLGTAKPQRYNDFEGPAQQRAKAEARKKGEVIRAAMPKIPGPGGVTPLPGGETPIPGPAPVPGPVAPPDTSGTTAAMARAKDRAGLIARGALTGLRESLGERGVLGGGVEGRATRGIAEAGMQQISDVNREQAIKESDQAQRMAEMVYQGGISQRGQDISMRGQDIQNQQFQAQQAQTQYQQMLAAVLDALKSQVY